MGNYLGKFQVIARNANKLSIKNQDEGDLEILHPFEERNIHPDIEKISKKLFDDGYYAHATFDAFKYIDKKVQELSKSNQTGYKLMIQAFNESSPLIKLTNLSTQSEIDEQMGYKFLFSGAAVAIRNPRGHEVFISETLNQCLDHISLASLLLRRLNSVQT